MNRAQKLKVLRELNKKQNELLNHINAGIAEMDINGKIENQEAYDAKLRKLKAETHALQNKFPA